MREYGRIRAELLPGPPPASTAVGVAGLALPGMMVEVEAVTVAWPWVIPATLLDTFIIAYPTKRYRSAWIGIAVHAAEGVVFATIGLTLVL